MNIKFTGGVFEPDTELKLFNENERISLIYGKNGSGKSTITKAILKAKGENIQDIVTSRIYDDSSEFIDPSIIHVFNEDYINSRVKISDDGLNAIVLFGELGGIEEQIRTVNETINTEKQNKVKQEAVCNKYNKIDSPESPLYFKSKINLALSGEAHWAEREKIINNGKRNASLTENVVKDIISTKIIHTESELKKVFSEKIDLLNQVRNNEATKIPNTSSINVKISISDLTKLLKVHLQKPKLNEREQYLLRLVEQGNSKQVDDMKMVFGNVDTKFCPFCLQSVEEEYKEDLVKSIEMILSKEVDEHKKKLSAFILQDIIFDDDPYEVLGSKHLKTMEMLITNINNEIHRINEVIQSKIEKPYLPIEDFSTDLEKLLIQCNEERNKLEDEIIQYNSVLNNTQQLIKELKNINKELARIEINVLYESYIKLLGLQNEDNNKMQEISNRLQEAETELKRLNAKKKSIGIAVNLINKSLRYVFFSKDRLEIKVEDEKYMLYSNGQAVKPNNVSVGERNIIALCYFFTELISNQNVKDGYSKEMILIVDDPVSSFDFENKVGIMSLLKEKFGQIILDNSKSKILVFTHDMQCMFDMQKIADEICAEYKKRNGGNKISYKGRELRNKRFIDFNYNKRHEYSELIKMVYDYAAGESEGLENIIGNTMRRVLEAFSTFLYKKGIDEISYDADILNTIEDPDYIDYFKNLMYRLVLNGESHMLERTRSLEDIEYLEFMSDEAKERTAKEVLCFMYLLNEKHVLAHLEGKNRVQENLQAWCKEIKAFQQEK